MNSFHHFALLPQSNNANLFKTRYKYSTNGIECIASSKSASNLHEK